MSPAVSEPVIDAHLHLWDRSANDYPWIGPHLGRLDADFTSADARAEFDRAGVAAAILVQAADHLRETRWLLNVARAHEWILGVVGWLPLEEPAALVAALDGEGGLPSGLCGARHLVHDDPRDDFLEFPAVRRSLAELARRGLAFDVPDAWPRHLAATERLAADIPDLTVVVDHLGKPPVGRPDYDDWLAALRRCAARPNVVAKFSGLQGPGFDVRVDTVRPLWETALELFGPDRLMYGGDWPMTLSYGGYLPIWEVVSQLAAELPASDRSAVLAGTAQRVYRVAAPNADPEGT